MDSAASDSWHSCPHPELYSLYTYTLGDFKCIFNKAMSVTKTQSIMLLLDLFIQVWKNAPIKLLEMYRSRMAIWGLALADHSN